MVTGASSDSEPEPETDDELDAEEVTFCPIPRDNQPKHTSALSLRISIMLTGLRRVGLFVSGSGRRRWGLCV